MALAFYTDKVGGGSGYSGSSEGSPKASGTGAATNATPTIDLSVDTPNLSTVVAGDTIRLNGRTDGIRNTDIFEITAVDDGLDTVTVTPTPGTTTSGVTWAIGGAFNTIGKSMLVCRSTDTVWIKNSADYTETVTISVLSASTNIIVEGYSGVTGDGGMVTVDGENARANGLDASVGGAGVYLYYVFKNIEFINHTSDGASLSTGLALTFKNCWFNSNGESGFSTGFINLLNFEKCQFNDNGKDGLEEGVGSTQRTCMVCCELMRNAFRGCFVSNPIISNCVFFDNGTIQIEAHSSSQIFINHCTIDGGSCDTIGVTFVDRNYLQPVIINTIIVGCASGFVAASGLGEMMTSRSNLLYDNTANYIGGAFTSEGEILSNPVFVSRHTQDYRLQDSSPAIGAGYDASSLAGVSSQCDIGAYQSE